MERFNSFQGNNEQYCSETPKLYFMETINFMYFLNNYNSKQLEAMFQSLTMPDHFKAKFRSLCDRYESGTRALYSLFFELDSTNQKRFVDYVTTNYKNNI